jgi:hypothetical protein
LLLLKQLLISIISISLSVQVGKDYAAGYHILCIPIIAYHDFKASGFTVVGNGDDDVSTDAKLFEAEMRYLYENGFNVITMADLGYDERTNSIYIK